MKEIFKKGKCEDDELLRNGLIREFYRLKAVIALEQVNSSVVEKKKNLNEQNFDGGANWSSIVNFHCIHRVL